MSKKPQLLIFDWDGTLMDSGSRILACVQAAAHDFNLLVPSEEEIRQGIGLNFTNQLNRLWPESEHQFDRDAFHECYEQHFERLYAEKHSPPLMEGAISLLETLSHSGFLLAIATSMQSKRLYHLLDDLNVRPLFQAIRCGDQAPPKPHPQMLFDILKALDVKPAEALMIGDTDYDMRMAQHACVNGIAVTYGMHDIDRLRQCQPVMYVDHLSELRDYLCILK